MEGGDTRKKGQKGEKDLSEDTEGVVVRERSGTGSDSDSNRSNTVVPDIVVGGAKDLEKA